MSEQIFKSQYDIGEFRRRVSALIEFDCEDTLAGHFKQQLPGNSHKYAGKFIKNKFSLWWYSLSTTGVLYSVIHGEIIAHPNSFTVKLNSRLNIVGKIEILIISSVLGYGLIQEVMDMKNNFLEYSGNGILILILGIIAIETALLYLYYAYKTHAIDALKEHLLLEETGK